MDIKTEMKRFIKALRKSKNTDRLRLHNTSTGKYYLPIDAKADYIAKDIKSNRIFD